MKLLHSKDYSSEYFDDALDLHAQLQHSADGLGLAEQFDKLLKQACDILKCKAILLAFDDIDTQFNTGWKVLESIRKYFNSPRLVVLMTGDQRLYSQWIRGKQYKNYDQVLLDQEKDEERLKRRSEMVDHLEQQYLLKLVPVHRRFILKNLYQMIEYDKEHKILVNTNKNAPETTIREAVEDMLKAGLHLKNGQDLKLYVDEILQQPIRLVIQLLQRYYGEKCQWENNKQAINKSSLSQLFNDAIRSTMIVSIYKAGLTYDNSDGHIGILCKDIFNYTLNDGDTNTSFYLRPQSELDVSKDSAIYLASMASKSAEGSLWKTLHLMMIGCGSVSLYERLLSTASVRPHYLESRSLRKSYLAYIGLGRNESFSHWANRSNALLCPVNNDNEFGIHPGLLRLKQFSKRSKPEMVMAQLAIEFACSDMLGRKRMTFMSLPNLIAAITDLVHKYSMNPSDLEAALYQTAARTTCSAPLWSTASRDRTAGDLEEGESSQAPSMGLTIDQASKDLIAIWLQEVSKVQVHIKPSAILLGKIWTRLYFNLDAISGEHRGILNRSTNSTNAAKIMRFNIIALLHAAMVEELFHHKTNAPQDINHSALILTGDRSNPLTVVDQFSRKLQQIIEQIDDGASSTPQKMAKMESTNINESSTVDDTEANEAYRKIKHQLPIFYMLTTCPLLHPFLVADGAVQKTGTSRKPEELLERNLLRLTHPLYGEEYSLKSQAIKSLKTAEINAFSKDKKKVSSRQSTKTKVLPISVVSNNS